MAQVADKNHAAFAELFDRQAPMVLGVLMRLLGQRWLAEEALQETFLQCWMQAGDYRPEQASPRAWLLMIARSRGLDRLPSGTSPQPSPEEREHASETSCHETPSPSGEGRGEVFGGIGIRNSYPGIRHVSPPAAGR
jgi:RNA polymerase sigma-70 factor (ECF subfamily)